MRTEAEAELLCRRNGGGVWFFFGSVGYFGLRRSVFPFIRDLESVEAQEDDLQLKGIQLQFWYLFDPL